MKNFPAGLAMVFCDLIFQDTAILADDWPHVALANAGLSAKAAFCGLPHSESEVYYVKSSAIGPPVANDRPTIQEVGATRLRAQKRKLESRWLTKFERTRTESITPRVFPSRTSQHRSSH